MTECCLCGAVSPGPFVAQAGLAGPKCDTSTDLGAPPRYISYYGVPHIPFHFKHTSLTSVGGLVYFGPGVTPLQIFWGTSTEHFLLLCPPHSVALLKHTSLTLVGGLVFFGSGVPSFASVCGVGFDVPGVTSVYQEELWIISLLGAHRHPLHPRRRNCLY